MNTLSPSLLYLTLMLTQLSLYSSIPSIPSIPLLPLSPHLASSGSTYDTWVSNAGPGGVPLTMKYYMTDLTNPVDVTYSGAKPEIRIKGPYVYRSLQETCVCVCDVCVMWVMCRAMCCVVHGCVAGVG